METDQEINSVNAETRNVDKSINTTRSIEKLDDVLDETTSPTNLMYVL